MATAYLDPSGPKTLVMNCSIRDPFAMSRMVATHAGGRQAGPTWPPPASPTPPTSAPKLGSRLRRRPLQIKQNTPRLHRLHRGRVEHRPPGRSGNRGYKTPLQGRLLPVPPVDHFSDLRDKMSLTLADVGLEVERAHHEVGTAGQAEINYKFGTLLHAADQVMLFKYVIQNVAWDAGLTATFMPKPLFGDNGSGSALPPVAVEGRLAVVLRRARLCRSVRPRSLVHRWPARHAPSLLAFTNPTVNSYHRLVPGFEAPVNLVYMPAQPFGLHSHPDHREQPEGQAARVPRSRPVRATRTSRSPAMLMAGLDGIKNKIEPVDPVDQDL